ncbi:hypothetical protein [Glycomyces sp. NPDC047010]|uniref:hypothetical protein n=1 Tax=Glycomyces sp. NPDC047010 TaxID=3155023 RepID=UPI0033C6E4EF
MPESIRSLLHDIGDDHSEPGGDLAAGAYRKARSISRKRIAAGAAGIAAALAIAGTGTAAWLDDGRDPDSGPGPAEGPTTDPDDVGSYGDEDEEIRFGCGIRPQDWDDLGVEFPDRGDSGTEQEMTELPYSLGYRVTNDDWMESTWRFGEDGEADGLDNQAEYVYHLAPDGNRVFAVDRTDSCGAAYMEIGYDTNFTDGFPFFSVEPVQCEIAWSPDSDKLLFTEPTVYEDAKTYVLDVATGELTAVAESGDDLFCASEWAPDGEHLWAGRTAVYNLDGSVAQELPGLEASLEDEQWLDTGISTDYGEACFDEYGEAEGDTVGRYCDAYVDTATGEELELPVDGEDRQVVFLYDGSMLILTHGDGTAVQYLVDPDGNVIDERQLPGDFADDIEELVMFYPW